MHVQTIYSNKHGRLTLTFNNWYKHDYIIQLVDYFFYRHHICPVWWTSASTDDRCDIPMGIHCAPLLADVVLHAYNAFFIQWLPKNKNWKLTQTLNSSFLYIWDGLELNNSRIDDYMHLINLSEFNSLLLTFTFTWQKRIYNKRDDFTCQIFYYKFIIFNIPEAPAYGVFITDVIR